MEQFVLQNVGALRRNAAIRDRVASITLSLHPDLKVMAVMEVKDLIEEWQAKKDESFLCLMLDVSTECRELSQAGDMAATFKDVSEAERVVLKLGGGDEPMIFEANIMNIMTIADRALDVPVLTSIKMKVKETACEVIAICIANCELDALLPAHFTSIPKQSESMKDILSGFINMSKLSGTRQSAMSFFKSCEGLSLASSSSMQLVTEILALIPGDVLVPDCLVTGQACVPADETSLVLKLLTGVNSLLAAFAFLNDEMASKPTACLADHILRADVSKAMSYVDTQCPLVVEALAQVRKVCVGRTALLKWSVHWSLIEQWLAAVPLVAVALRQLIMQAMVSDLHGVSLSVEKLTPKYDHYITDKLYNKALAKRNLVNSSSKDSMSKATVTMFKCLSQIGRYHVASGLPDPRKDPLHADVLSSADCVYEGAKNAVAVTAAATVLATMKGQLLIANSEALLKGHKQCLPAALIDELKLASSR